MQRLIAAGGVVYRNEEKNTEVLLIYRNKVWDLPKGKREEGESIKACARREVAEEVGIPLPEIECFLAKTYHEYKRNGREYGKYTHWYRMRISGFKELKPQVEEGIEDVQWVELNEAERKVSYENLKKVLQAFKVSIS